MTQLSIDIETYSSVDLKKAGVHRYVEASDFQVMLFAYAFGNDPVRVIDLMAGNERIPPDVITAIFDPTIIKTAFNAAFEIACLSKHFSKQLDPAQWRCTSVHALTLGLPGNLGDLGKAMRMPQDKQKMGVGGGLIRYFCIPCKPTKKNGERTRNLWFHEPAKWQLFKDYCARDVESERAIRDRLSRFPVSDIEQRLWVLDQQMNTRGIQVDLELVEAAIECDAIYKKRLTDEAIAITGLANPNSRNQLIKWLQEEEDDSITDITKKTVPKVLASTDNDVVRRMLELRQELAKTSVSKYKAMATAVCRDGCIRGLLQFYGANRTGRWAGRLVQVQNLPQNKLKDIDLARNLLKARDYDTLELLFGNVPDTLSQLIRTAFVAREGRRLIDVDFSAIEARVIAWLAWCEWRMQVFATHGKIYEASAEQMFHLEPGSVTKKSPYRQRGKVAELALGYQGGAGALKTMGALDMGLKEEELDDVKNAWRAANPEIVDLWYESERCAKAAVQGKTRTEMPIAGGRAKIVFSYESGYLFITLPSGRRLAYVMPRIEPRDLMSEKGFLIAQAGSLTYEGLDQKTKQWGRVATYGGKLVENITQAIARDCLRESMFAIDEVGCYDQLMTVHDEIVIEADHGVGSLAEIEEIMDYKLPWAPGLKLGGDGFETQYFMKEIE